MTRWMAALAVCFLVAGCGDDSGDEGNENNQNNSTAPVCGDGDVGAGEQCDEGPQNSDVAADACRTSCREAWCGDGVVDTGEQCDEGPANSDLIAGACRRDCQLHHCGDAVLDPGEECDDGNGVAGDGCSDQCRVEVDWTCSGAPSLCVCEPFRRGDYCEQCRVYVSLSATGLERDGLTWDTAFHTVQEGIDAAYAATFGCEVWVAAGTYRVFQTSVFNTVTLRSGVALYGGFAGGETSRDARNPTVNETILDGGHPTENVQTIHVVTALETVDATLDGVTVRGGFAQGPRAEDSLGAGMQALGATMTIASCRFEDNYSTRDGGGLYLYGSDLVIRDSSFVANRAIGDGAGILVAFSTLSLDRCEIRGNSTVLAASLNGGGVNIQASAVQAVNTLIVDNLATGLGGGIYAVYSPEITLLHCTVASNTAYTNGHSFYRSTNSVLKITSSVISGAHYPANAVDITASYSVMPTTWPAGAGTENLTTDATFVGGGDYHLQGTSAGVDHADGLAAPATDLEGNPRYDAGTDDTYDCAGQTSCVSFADSGAYEYHP